MAIAVDFPESNLVLTGPLGMEDPDVYPLHARRIDGSVVTCWQLSPLDVDGLAASGGKLWLSVWGHSMPPTLISGRKEDVI